MVVFWKEDSGRQPQMITPENEGGDETNDPSPLNFTSFDDPDVPFGPCGLPGPPGPPGSPGHRLVMERGREPEIHRVSDCIRDLHHLSLNLFQFQ